MFCHICGEKLHLRNEINESPISSFLIKKRGKHTILPTYIGNDPDVIIPHGITQIGDCAFADRDGINSVVIPDSVVYIGESSFAGCSLKSIVIPDSVIAIMDYAFCNIQAESIDIRLIFRTASQLLEKVHLTVVKILKNANYLIVSRT